MTNNDKNYEKLKSLIDYDIYQYSSNPNMPCAEVSLAGYIAANLTTRGYCKVNEEQVRKDTAKEILDKIWYALNNGVLFPVICKLKEDYGVEVDDE